MNCGGLTLSAVFFALLCLSISSSMEAVADPEAVVVTELETEEALYPGSEVGQRITVQVPARRQPEVKAPPRLELENARKVDFSSLDPPWPSFYEVKQERREIDGEEYFIWHFYTRLAITGAGTLSGKGSVEVSMKEDDWRRQAEHGVFNHHPGDWLFRRQRGTERKDFHLPPRLISLRPGPPDPGFFTGLTGEWRIKAELDRVEARAGETVELVMQAQGRGDPYRWRLFRLGLNGFEELDAEAEVKRISPERSRITIRWRLRPTGQETRFPELVWYTFDSAEETYREHLLAPELTVLPAEPAPPEEALDEERLRSLRKLHYLHTDWSEGLKSPWWRHGLTMTVVCLSAGLAALFLAVKLKLRRQWLEESGAAGYRREQALQKKNKLLRSLRSADSEQLARRLKEEAVPWLIDFMGLPPGTTADELAQHLQTTEPELAAMIEVLDRYEYEPGLKSRLDKRRLMTALRRIGRLAVFPLVAVCFMFVFSGLSSEAAALSADSSREDSREAIFQAGIEAYSQGDYRQADNLFSQLERPDRVNPILLYNRANSLWLSGEQWQALALMERARRASPRDYRINGNLALFRDQMNLPPAVGEDSGRLGKVVLWRDCLRPDEWLRLAALFFALSMVILWLGEKRGCGWSRKGLSAMVVLPLIPLLALGSQLLTTYRPLSRGAIVQETVLRDAPFRFAETGMTPQGAQRIVEIREHRMGWMRIRTDGREGWIPEDRVIPFWRDKH